MDKNLGAFNLDKQIISDLESLNLIPQKIIFSNPRKKRFDLLVRKEDCDDLYFLKWSHPNAPKIHINKLRKEIEFYKNHKGSRFLLRLRYSGDNFLLLEYLDAITIRYWLINYKNNLSGNKESLSEDYKLLIKKLCNSLEELYFNSVNKKPENIDVEDTSKRIMTNWGKLLSSGPMCTSRTPIENYIGRLLALYSSRIIFSYIKKMLDKYANTKFNSGEIHGDLHANNVLVSKDNLNIKIVDWENIEEGLWLIDFTYIYVMLHTMMKNLPKHQKFLYDSFNELISNYYPEFKEAFFRICDLLKIAISTNRRFQHKLPSWRLVTEYIYFPFRIFGFYFLVYVLS